MSLPIIIPEPEIKPEEIDSWLRKYKLKKNTINITKATNALRAEKQEDAIPAGREVSVTGSDATRRVIYGECKVGGTIVFIDSRANNQYIDLVIALATHEIEGVTKLYVGEAEVVFQAGTDGWSNHIILPDGTHYPAFNKIFLRVATGADDQTAIGDLIGQNPSKWTWDHKLSGIAHAYIILVWDGVLFGDGLPDISFRVQGKLVYDPRTDTNRYTATTALIIADYLTNTRFGMGRPYERLDEANLIEAADICDETVTIQNGGTEYRYAVHGYFDVGEAHGRILERLAANMGGNITYSNGLWKFWPAAWREPTIVLTEDDLRSSVKIQTLTTRDDIFNAVRGTFVDGSRDFIVTDYPAVKNSTYATQDGEVIFENINMHFVTSSATCQRLAKLELERIRQGIQIEVQASLKAYQLQVPEVVAITLDRYGWDEKTFEVTRCDFIVKESGSSPELVVDLSLRETAEGVFEFNYWEETTVDLSPNTNLPSPFSVPSLVGLVATSGTADLYRRGDGTIAPRIKVSWTALADFFVTSGGFIEVQFRKSADVDWVDATRIPGSSTFMYLSDVQDGQYYYIRARAISFWGSDGPYITISDHYVEGKTVKPTNVSGFAAAVNEYGIEFAWQAIPDLDLSFYEIREGSDWDTGTVVGKPKDIGYKLSFRAAGSYTFKIKAVDTTGNYSTTEASAGVVITAPMVGGGSFSFNAENVLLDWDDATGGSWATEDYSVSYGSSFGSSTFVAKAKASQFSVRASWSGLRKFWVVPNDIYGNAGTPFSFDVTVIAPPAVTNLTQKVIDNNVLLSWGSSSGGSLPIDYYQIKKGATFGASTLIGTAYATYSTLFEIVSGSYTYWIVPVDTAGNVGTEFSITATVDEPIDFILQSYAMLDLSTASVLTNILVEDAGTLLLPVNTTETWTEHFTDNSWTTPQDQIDDSYPIYIQPTLATATYTQTHDIGTIITGGSLIRFDVSTIEIAAGLTLTPTLSVSPDNSAWTDYPGVYSVFEAGFRYVKLSIAASGGGTALNRINSVEVTVAVKLKRDSGSLTALASEAAGTEVEFNQEFYDIVGAPQVTCTEIIRAAQTWGITSSYLTGGDQTDFEPGNGDFTIACWVKFDSIAGNPSIISKWDSASGTQAEYLLQVNASKNFIFLISNTGSDIPVWAEATNFGTVPTGVWLHVVAWHDAVNNFVGIRVNRTAENTTSYSSGIYAGTRTNSLELMGRSTTGGRTVNGQMKNAAIWKGRVLSGSDIEALYDAGFQRYSELSAGIKTSMVGFWEMSEASGTREDSHTSNHDLTVGGTVAGRVLPVFGLADFEDVPDPTEFYAYLFTESQVRVSAAASWYADGYTSIG